MKTSNTYGFKGIFKKKFGFLPKALDSDTYQK